MKTPWLPKPPKDRPKRKCTRCKGEGTTEVWSTWGIKNEHATCNKCGGKGFV